MLRRVKRSHPHTAGVFQGGLEQPSSQAKNSILLCKAGRCERC
jgi:hypothetical protein